LQSVQHIGFHSCVFYARDATCVNEFTPLHVLLKSGTLGFAMLEGQLT